MTVFGEPLEDEPPVKVPRKRKHNLPEKPTGWHRKAGETWKARKREREKAVARVKAKRPRVVSRRDDEPCPKCYAPMRDGECTGAFAKAHGGHGIVLDAPCTTVTMEVGK